MDSERTFLLDSLTTQREHVLGILEGVADDDLRRPLLPSGWTCLGLVQHLTVDVELFWFRGIVAGEDVAMNDTDESMNAAWLVPPDVSAPEMFAAHRQQIELADAILGATPLDAPPAFWPEEMWPNWRMTELRQIALHVIAETACHAGHLDAARELIDGHQWLG